MIDISDFSRKINRIKKYDSVYNIFWKTIYNKLSCDLNCKLDIRILLLNAPCNGFGDIIFSMKIASYLKDWYRGCTVNIASFEPELFLTLGEKKENLIHLLSKEKDSCLQFDDVTESVDLDNKTVSLENYDLYFVCPITSDYSPEYEEVSGLIKNSNEFNTHFFSEYNFGKKKYTSFPLGVGEGKMGLLFTDVCSKKQNIIKNKYTVCYIAQSIKNSTKCFLSFLYLLEKKYMGYEKFEIIIPEWLVKYIIVDYSFLKEFRVNVVIKKGDGSKITIDNGYKNTFYIRGDILPLPYNKMTSLLNGTVRDVLVTGDQSITDVLSCCEDKKNIFYQIAPWKESFAKYLSLYLPEENLKKKTTSCGNIENIHHKSNYKKFVEEWDFRKLGRKKLDSIVLSTYIFSPLYEKIIKSYRTKSLKVFREELHSMIEDHLSNY